MMGNVYTFPDQRLGTNPANMGSTLGRDDPPPGRVYDINRQWGLF
jgi:hypothetical protein